MAQSLVSRGQNRPSIVHNVESSTYIEPAHRHTDEDKFLSLVKIYDDHERKKNANMQNYNMITNCKLKTEHQKKEVVEKQRSRRSRKDKEGRDHICGCGKTYLSYPALYTHIKQKHQGRAPEGTFRMNSNGPSRRGRPRRERKQESIHSIQENPARNQLPRILKNMIKAEKLIIFEQYEELVKGTILPENIKFPKFVEELEVVKKEHPKQLTIEMSIDRIMAIYLYNMTDIVNQKFFEELQEILVLLRSCLNQHHNKLQASYQKVSNIYTGDPVQQQGKKAQYTESHSCEYLPLISEYFILKYVPTVCPMADPKLIVIVVQDFCEWLWANKLTHLRLTTYSIETIPNFSLADINFT